MLEICIWSDQFSALDRDLPIRSGVNQCIIPLQCFLRLTWELITRHPSENQGNKHESRIKRKPGDANHPSNFSADGSSFSVLQKIGLDRYRLCVSKICQSSTTNFPITYWVFDRFWASFHSPSPPPYPHFFDYDPSSSLHVYDWIQCKHSSLPNVSVNQREKLQLNSINTLVIIFS